MKKPTKTRTKRTMLDRVTRRINRLRHLLDTTENDIAAARVYIKVAKAEIASLEEARERLRSKQP